MSVVSLDIGLLSLLRISDRLLRFL